MSEVLIKVDGVSKKFCKNLKQSLAYGFRDVFDSVIGKKPSLKLRNDEFWAVKDISFEVKRGECLGLIGHNGAGKSTLLKMLNGLIRPDEGSIEMHGKVGALIELGAGFNSLLTGRENIYNNGAVLGFTKQEIDEKLNEIIIFSELEEFIDMPVQNYSSGMKVRLGFAIAAQMEPDILLIDEVLAVGDMGFVLKCFNQMDKLLQNTALILVSHGMPQISRMCTHVILMDHGKVLCNTDDVSYGITEYYKRFKTQIGDYNGSDKVELIDIRLISNDSLYHKEDDILINYGDPLKIEIEIFCNEFVYSPSIHLAFFDKEQRSFAAISNCSEYVKLDKVAGKITFSTQIDNIPFSQGKYSISIKFSEDGESVRNTLFRYQSAIYFSVHNKTHGWTPIQFNPKWIVNIDY
jgi:lipopolysaccharide transport system ATP-binding protein